MLSGVHKNTTKKVNCEEFVLLYFVIHALFLRLERADDYDTERESDGSSGLARFHAEINRVADEFFYRLGHWVATFPERTLAIGLVCVALCCTGFLNFVVESSGRFYAAAT